MAISFPPSPSLYQSYTYDGITYVWNGFEWVNNTPRNTKNSFNKIQIGGKEQFDAFSYRYINFEGININIFSADTNTIIFSALSSSTSSTTFTGGTVSGPTNFTNGLTANTISATTYQNLPSSTLSGGTVSGATNFTNGLTANTISVITINSSVALAGNPTTTTQSPGTNNTTIATTEFVNSAASNDQFILASQIFS